MSCSGIRISGTRRGRRRSWPAEACGLFVASMDLLAKLISCETVLVADETRTNCRKLMTRSAKTDVFVTAAELVEKLAT